MKNGGKTKVLRLSFCSVYLYKNIIYEIYECTYRFMSVLIDLIIDL